MNNTVNSDKIGFFVLTFDRLPLDVVLFPDRWLLFIYTTFDIVANYFANCPIMEDSMSKILIYTHWMNYGCCSRTWQTTRTTIWTGAMAPRHLHNGGILCSSSTSRVGRSHHHPQHLRAGSATFSRRLSSCPRLTHSPKYPKLIRARWIHHSNKVSHLINWSMYFSCDRLYCFFTRDLGSFCFSVGNRQTSMIKRGPAPPPPPPPGNRGGGYPQGGTSAPPPPPPPPAITMRSWATEATFCYRALLYQKRFPILNT